VTSEPRRVTGWTAAAALAVGRRPRLWWPAVLQVVAFAPGRWWCRFPPLPLPDRRWLAFRMETAYGDPRARPPASDVVAYLEWFQESRFRAGRVH
jgi:hypothetical protein